MAKKKAQEVKKAEEIKVEDTIETAVEPVEVEVTEVETPIEETVEEVVEVEEPKPAKPAKKKEAKKEIVNEVVDVYRDIEIPADISLKGRMSIIFATFGFKVEEKDGKLVVSVTEVTPELQQAFRAVGFPEPQ